MNQIIQKQTIMNRVLYALLPLLLFSIFNFGWYVVAVVATTNLFAFLTEYLFIRKKKMKKVSMAVFVSGSLIGMILPPTIPLWVAAVASVVGITFGKMVFGGFGMNVFNPAIVGRTFVYISFPKMMTVQWLKPFRFSDFPGGFLHWFPQENITSATPMITFRDSNSEIMRSFQDIFLGNIEGSIGETSALLIILSAIYLIVTKTAKWQPMLATLIGFIVSTFLFYHQFNPLFFLCSGGILFGLVFMSTDPVSMPKNKLAIWIYGLLVGFLTVFIRKYSLFVEGFMFALLLGNTMMPIIEYSLNKLGIGKK